MDIQLSVNLVIIIITVLVSMWGFSSQKVINDLIFYPPAVSRQNQFYRFFTCGFIHADYGHLIFNMITLFAFGNNIEKAFVELFGSLGRWLYLLMYISALAVSLLPTYNKNKDNQYYRSLGASGAVSAVLFAGLLLQPTSSVYMFFIPIPIPGFIFAPAYLLLSAYMDKKGGDNINHSAHIWGALYGLGFVIIACYAVGFPVIQNAIEKISGYFA